MIVAEYPAIPLFTDAFIADTIHLNAAQTGAYLMLLMCAWRSPNCSIPNDDKILARFARMTTREWKSNKDIILSFWDEKEGLLSQKRLVDERKFADDKRDKAIRAGRASALKRKKRHSTDVELGLQHNTQHKPNYPTPTPTSKKTITKVISKKEKITLENLSIDHIEKWLIQKRVAGKYLNIDETELLEMFKDYCKAKNPKYKDYVAAFRNSFKWQNAPKKGEVYGKSRKQRLDEATQRGIAKAIVAENFTNSQLVEPELLNFQRLREKS